MQSLKRRESGRLKIVGEFKKVDMLASYADNVIVGTALKIKETNPEVVLMTTDINMKIAAESAGLIIKESANVKRPAQGKVFALVIALIVIVGFYRSLSRGSAYAFILYFLTVGITVFLRSYIFILPMGATSINPETTRARPAVSITIKQRTGSLPDIMIPEGHPKMIMER